MNLELNKVYNQDCIDFLKSLPDNSIDSIVTDPPAGISFMSKKWDDDKGGKKQWIAWMESVMVECLRVLKPGGHALVWAIPRTSHWTTNAIEDAGFEIRDKVYHIFGTGFPKSLDISKQIDKQLGAEREIIGKSQWYGRNPNGQRPFELNPTGRKHKGQDKNYGVDNRTDSEYNVITKPATPESTKYSGWGTALKPATEEWILARKPLEKGLTVAENIMKWGTAGINIDGCRIGTGYRRMCGSTDKSGQSSYILGERRETTTELGRFPANLILDDSPEVKEEFDKYGNTKSGKVKSNKDSYGEDSMFFDGVTNLDNQHGDAGSVTRFFYCAKASVEDREEGLDGFEGKMLDAGRGEDSIGGSNPRNRAAQNKRTNHHPTVKNTSLMMYLCRLITPVNGVVFDPFSGSGSTGKAAILEGFNFIGCELDPEYVKIANARIKYTIENKEKLIKIYSDKVDKIIPTKTTIINNNDFF